MTFANKFALRHSWLFVPAILLLTGTLHAQVPDLAPAEKSSKPAAARDTTTPPAPAATPQAPAASAPIPSGPDGPFGFYAGETREQIIAAVGKAAIKKEKKDTLEISAAPRPDPHFDTYTLILSPKAGLLKVVATGKDQNEDASGVKVRSEYAAVKTDVTTVYGPATESFDFIKSTSKHKAADEFILSLTNGERTLAAYWTKSAFPNNVNSISLEADGLGNELGYLSLEFEFNGYAAFITAK